LGLVSSDVSEERTVSVFGVTEFVSVLVAAADPGGREVAIAGIEGSNVAENMDVCPWCILCDVYVAASATNGSLVQRRPTGCVSKCVWSRTLNNEAS